MLERCQYRVTFAYSNSINTTVGVVANMHPEVEVRTILCMYNVFVQLCTYPAHVISSYANSFACEQAHENSD